LQRYWIWIIVLLTSCSSPPEPTLPVAEMDPSLREGQRLYRRVGCVQCHGRDGRGATPHAFKLRNRPTDLTRASEYRFGATAGHIFDVLTHGIEGSYMRPWTGALDEDERWKVSEYVEALQRGGSHKKGPKQSPPPTKKPGSKKQ